MLKEIFKNLYESLSGHGMAPIVEFATATFVVCIAYMAIHRVHKKGKVQYKFLLALILGIVSYAMAKVIVITWLVKPLIF